jgi:hypothetical protein
LTATDKDILSAFFSKRQLFDDYIKEKTLPLFTCPGCGYPSLSVRGSYEICAVCNWEDDGQDDAQADEVWGGPNGHLSLTENRITIGRILDANAAAAHSVINLDPAFVLHTLEHYASKKEALINNMTGEETMEHPVWQAWQQVEKDLQVALCGNPH